METNSNDGGKERRRMDKERKNKMKYEECGVESG